MDLRAQVTEPEAQSSDPSIPATELAEALRNRDWYRVLSQSIAAQVQGLRDGCDNIVSYATSAQSSLRDGFESLPNEFEPSSPRYWYISFQCNKTWFTVLEVSSQTLPLEPLSYTFVVIYLFSFV